MSRVLVTGANGFIGSHLCAKLAADGAEVAALTRTSANLVRFELLGVAPKQYQLDSFDDSALARVLGDSRPETVFHLASSGIRRSHEVDRETIRINVMGSFELMRACAAVGVERLVLLGSGFEYAPNSSPSGENQPAAPFSFYGATKAAAWQIGRQLSQSGDMDIVLARLFTTYGPAENLKRIYPFVISNALRGRECSMTSGQQMRDYLFVDDVVDALLILARSPGLNGAAVNVCSGEPISIRAIAETIFEEQGADPSLLKFGAIPDRQNEPPFLVGDCTRLRDLGWTRKHSSREGIAKTLKWYRNFLDIWERLP